jgi:hypothetical protein
MKFGLIKNMVGALAPTLGSALGGPLGGQAASVIAERTWMSIRSQVY